MLKKGHNSAMTSLTEKKNNMGPLIFHGYSTYQISRSYLSQFLTVCKPKARTDRPTNRPKPICHLNFFELGGTIRGDKIISQIPIRGNYRSSQMQCTLHVLVISRKPSQNFSVVKIFQECNLPDFRFYLSKLINKYFPSMV